METVFPRFTVVTPNYNMGKLLGETIESVLSNLKPSDQYFIIDGGSTDGSVDIIKSYDKHLTGWVSEPDKGYADALAKGFRRGNGEFQCYVNSGDLLLKDALNNAQEFINETGADMVFGDDLYVDEQSLVISHSPGYVDSLMMWMLYGGWTPLQDACFWRRSLYESIGGIDPDTKYAADYELFLKMSIHGKTTYAPFIFSAFRKHEGQKSIQGANSYVKERSCFQQKMISCTTSSRLLKLLRTIEYSIKARWRARITTRAHKSRVPIGIPISRISCMRIDNAKR